MADNTNQDDKHLDEFERDELEDGLFHPDQVPRLAEDGNSPASEPTDVLGNKIINREHPDTDSDSDIDPDERYHEGLGEATSVEGTLIDSDDVQIVDDDTENANGRFQ